MAKQTSAEIQAGYDPKWVPKIAADLQVSTTAFGMAKAAEQNGPLPRLACIIRKDGLWTVLCHEKLNLESYNLSQISQYMIAEQDVLRRRIKDVSHYYGSDISSNDKYKSVTSDKIASWSRC